MAARHKVAGRYEILGLLGVGGMGSVYRARDLELDEVVALKMLRPELCNSVDMLERFKQEVKLARRVTHVHVARTFDIGDDAGERFLTMEFIEGESLATVLERHGALPLARVLELALPICAGLGAAHRAGIVHRDLKPDNVMIERGERVVITDFGIARSHLRDATQTAQALVGTPAYMAPEQVVADKGIDARADLYALGAMLFEMSTGHRAWPGEAAIAVAAARLASPAPDPRVRRPELPEAFAAIVQRCMARHAADRFASAEEVAGELASLAAGAPSRASDRAAAIPWSRAGEAIAVRSGSTPILADARVVAVLPFRNAGAPADDDLADGLTDDLIDALSMTRGLRVRSRGAVQRLKGVERDPRELGAELGVEAVVEGSVRRVEKMVRITARVSSVSEGFQLWAQRFERPASDLLVVNDEVARAVAEALTLEGPSTGRDAVTDPIAIELYLRARPAARGFRRGQLETAIDLLEQALARAPDDATLLSVYAMARARLWFFAGPDAARSGELAIAAAERAVAIAPHLAEARLALAIVRLQAGNVAAAVVELARALGRSPGLADAHGQLGRILLEVGRPEEALRRLEVAMGLDPNLHQCRLDLTRAHLVLRHNEQALAIVEPPPEESMVGPVWVSRARVAMWLARPDLAERWLAEMGPEGDPTIGMTRMALMAIAGKMPSSQRLPSFLSSHGGHGTGARRLSFLLQLAAELDAYLGHDDDALDALEQAVTHRLVDIVWLDRCPMFDRLRANARFQWVRDEVGERARRVLEAWDASVQGPA
jgi:serine/threonine-protein kinase